MASRIRSFGWLDIIPMERPENFVKHQKRVVFMSKWKPRRSGKHCPSYSHPHISLTWTAPDCETGAGNRKIFTHGCTGPPRYLNLKPSTVTVPFESFRVPVNIE